MPIVRSSKERLRSAEKACGAEKASKASKVSNSLTVNSVRDEKQKKHLLEKLASVLRIPAASSAASSPLTYPPFQRIPNYTEDDAEDDVSSASSSSASSSASSSGRPGDEISEEEDEEEDAEEDCSRMYLAAELKRREETLARYAAMIKGTKEVSLRKMVFFGEGCEVFDELCLLIDVNQRYASLLPQWKDVADALEIDSIRTKWVETCVRPREGLTRAMLEIYMKDGGTLGEVLEALFRLQCYEILEKVLPKVNRFLDALESVKKGQIKLSSSSSDKFFSVIQTLAAVLGAGDPCQELHKFLDRGLKKTGDDDHSNNQLCCPFVPEGPALSGIKAASSSNSDKDKDDEGSKKSGKEQPDMVFKSELHLNQIKENERFLKEQSFSRVGADGKLRCKILLLFSGDGTEAANLTAVIARSVENEKVVADVFRLNEASLWYEVLTNPEASCMKWIYEADYIMPVLTPKFLQEIHCNATSADDEDQGLLPTSPVINRYMYTLARSQYTQAACKNFKVRPVIPLSCLRVIRMSDSVKMDPLFNSSWIPLSEDRLERRIGGMLNEFLRRRQVAMEATMASGQTSSSSHSPRPLSSSPPTTTRC